MGGETERERDKILGIIYLNENVDIYSQLLSG